MNLNDYQFAAADTAIYPKEIGLQYTILGLCGEAGELANTYKKVLRDDGAVLSVKKSQKLVDELGDCLWYVAMIAEELGLSLNTIAERNLIKLAARKTNNTLTGSGDNR